MVIMLPVLPLIHFFTFNLITNSNIDHREILDLKYVGYVEGTNFDKLLSANFNIPTY
jgi:hypothetical protein